MTSTRKISLTAGVFYLLTFVSIPILYLYGPVREVGYIVGPGPDTRVFVGAVLEIIVALAGIGTAVALFPVVKRQNEGVALGFVATRTLEAGGIFASVFVLLAIVTLRQAGAGAAAAGHRPDAGRLARLDVHAQPEPPSGRERPAARIAALPVAPGAADPPLLGFIGAALLVTSTMATLFGANEYGSAMSGLLAIPIAVWEFSLGVYLVVKGFRAAGLQKLGFETDEPVAPDVPASAMAPKSELRPAA